MAELLADGTLLLWGCQYQQTGFLDYGNIECYQAGDREVWLVSAGSHQLAQVLVDCRHTPVLAHLPNSHLLCCSPMQLVDRPGLDCLPVLVRLLKEAYSQGWVPVLRDRCVWRTTEGDRVLCHFKPRPQGWGRRQVLCELRDFVGRVVEGQQDKALWQIEAQCKHTTPSFGATALALAITEELQFPMSL